MATDARSLGRVLSGAPRVAPFFADLDPSAGGGRLRERGPGRVHRDLVRGAGLRRDRQGHGAGEPPARGRGGGPHRRLDHPEGRGGGALPGGDGRLRRGRPLRRDEPGGRRRRARSASASPPRRRSTSWPPPAASTRSSPTATTSSSSGRTPGSSRAAPSPSRPRSRTRSPASGRSSRRLRRRLRQRRAPVEPRRHGRPRQVPGRPASSARTARTRRSPSWPTRPATAGARPCGSATPTGASSDAWLGRQRAHWSFYCDSDASVLEGNEIEDQGGG